MQKFYGSSSYESPYTKMILSLRIIVILCNKQSSPITLPETFPKTSKKNFFSKLAFFLFISFSKTIGADGYSKMIFY